MHVVVALALVGLSLAKPFSGNAAKMNRFCSSVRSSVTIHHLQHSASAYCSHYTKTVTTTDTPTVTVTRTQTSIEGTQTIYTATRDSDQCVSTVTSPSSTTTVRTATVPSTSLVTNDLASCTATPSADRKRDASPQSPTFPPRRWPPSKISSACSCLSVTPSRTATVTHTATPVTHTKQVTTSVEVTVTTASIICSPVTSYTTKYTGVQTATDFTTTVTQGTTTQTVYPSFKIVAADVQPSGFPGGQYYAYLQLQAEFGFSQAVFGTSAADTFSLTGSGYLYDVDHGPGLMASDDPRGGDVLFNIGDLTSAHEYGLNPVQCKVLVPNARSGDADACELQCSTLGLPPLNHFCATSHSDTVTYDPSYWTVDGDLCPYTFRSYVITE